MPTVVVPYRGTEGKSRLVRLPVEARAAIRAAMLADVVAASEALGPVYVVTSARPDVRATIVPDHGGGQGAAVRAGLDRAVREESASPFLVVNADLPCATARDLLTLAGSIPPGGLALAAAADGTTNALALSWAELFAPVYGPGSARRFGALAPARLVQAPNLIDDVDTEDDLERLGDRLGPHTARVLAQLRVGAGTA
jgi:2-phospho-L-lactate guanylyltransferase (CobY/MobA/RfbA family)